jgi:AAA domain
MNFEFRPAIREAVSLLIGLIGPSGGGKTYTAMRLAKGICGDKPFAVIDTEAGRAKHYADIFKFDHGDLKSPFRPSTYADAIRSADEAGYKAVIVDSCSHEWAGEGGILDWQEEELFRMAGDNYSKREACKMAAWIR